MVFRCRASLGGIVALDRMTFLHVCKQKKNRDTFETFVATLLAEGHRVVLTIQERDPARDARIVEQFGHPQLTIVGCPDGRSDDWRTAAPLVRTARAARRGLSAAARGCSMR